LGDLDTGLTDCFFFGYVLLAAGSTTNSVVLLVSFLKYGQHRKEVAREPGFLSPKLSVCQLLHSYLTGLTLLMEASLSDSM
jgi:hypothetical protein